MSDIHVYAEKETINVVVEMAKPLDLPIVARIYQ